MFHITSSFLYFVEFQSLFTQLTNSFDEIRQFILLLIGLYTPYQVGISRHKCYLLAHSFTPPPFFFLIFRFHYITFCFICQDNKLFCLYFCVKLSERGGTNVQTHPRPAGGQGLIPKRPCRISEMYASLLLSLRNGQAGHSHGRADKAGRFLPHQHGLSAGAHGREKTLSGEP